MDWRSFVPFLSGIAGVVLTLVVQSLRDSRRRRRMGAACRELIKNELQMLWFDLTGTVRPGSARFFARQTEMWDTFKTMLPELFTVKEVQAVAKAYYWTKDLQYRIAQGTVLDYETETDVARRAVVDAIHRLGGNVPPVMEPEDNAGRASTSS